MGAWRFGSTILNLGTRRDEWSASSPSPITVGELAPNTHRQEVGWAPAPVWTLWRREKYPSRTPIPRPLGPAFISSLNIAFFQSRDIFIRNDADTSQFN
jgi:hypothetical protein